MAAAPQRRAVLGLSGLLLASCAVAQAGPVGSGLLPGAVPYAYAGWVGRAGALCAAFPPAVIAAQVKTESDWNPRAVGPAPARAQGIAQFLPAAWARYGRDDDGSGTADPLEPGDAIMAMGRYDCALAADLSTGQGSGRLRGDLTSLALAAYNAGVGAVLAARGVPPYPET
ncbi:lytic transglycosylase domain-containing protein [Streptacidiphilus sp. ASG 303]|uniref:lytic transglycosylase domain-containing protein n=1 Tax=Streptacidiphilus sp. ASG 303 TaxID=2896847 RepID=UPI001E3705BE|nr:lytic transglycosylase domain-containing protein [Streptacidiphilus sp. ASG 303]MCD0486103.1 lytic transglycosylase domain-containing protein [Streptacidiphilus sp. ASG 303]